MWRHLSLESCIFEPDADGVPNFCECERSRVTKHVHSFSHLTIDGSIYCADQRSPSATYNTLNSAQRTAGDHFILLTSNFSAFREKISNKSVVSLTYWQCQQEIKKSCGFHSLVSLMQYAMPSMLRNLMAPRGVSIRNVDGNILQRHSMNDITDFRLEVDWNS